MSSLTVSTLRTDVIKSPITGTTSLLIDSSGRSLAPNQPAFYGYRSAGAVWENYGTTPAVYNYNVAVTNRGNCYNTTSGTFTCPVSGVYAVAPGGLMGANGGSTTLNVYVNNVNKTARGVHSNTSGTSNWFYNSTIFMLRCVKDDQIQIRATNSAASIYADKHSHCSIWLYS
jgi:hypothetical protein